METNYELKHKCLLVPLKAVLLVVAMLLVGFTTFAQSGKSVRVATNEQLIEAMQNPSVGTIELQAGNYPYLNYQADEGARVIKSEQNSSGRSADCLYYIINNKQCFEPLLDPMDPFFGYAAMFIWSGFINPGCGDCCPPYHDYPGGTWSVSYKPDGSTVIFDDPTKEETFFWANMTGQYILRYSWPAPWNSHVETQYFFYGPVTVDLEANDVCETDGLSTDVTFTLESSYLDPLTIVAWTLDSEPYDGPDETETFTLFVDECGAHTLAVYVQGECGIVQEEITIWFDCEPTAYAGGDVSVCGDICVFLDGEVSVAIPHPFAYSYSWVNVSGPQDQTLSFSPDGGYMQTDVTACRDEFIPGGDCPYGEYEVQLQVQNGLCYDDDNALVRFYQQPTSNAGPDQHLCNIFTFQLDATPFMYCGTAGVNYWATGYWEIVSKADPNADIAFTPSVNDPDASVTITSTALCPYGEYVFRWVEVNSAYPREGCTASDEVSIFIYEDPAPYAGGDLVFCNTFAFSLWGIGDEPCYEGTVVEYSWAKTCQPGDAVVTIIPSNDPINPNVVIDTTNTTECNYGKYCFELTQCNGYLGENDQFEDVCCSTDAKEIWILEEADADAGPDQHLCNTFNFNLGAVPTDFCGTAGVNYFTWGVWEFVSGPTSAVVLNPNDPASGVTIDPNVTCPYGIYTFKWTEYNGFGNPFQGCWDVDYVEIYVYEVPVDVNAGPDQAFCDDFTFALDGALDEPCGVTSGYSYVWSVVTQPDPTCVVSIEPYGLDPAVSITECQVCGYGEYVFRLTQMNGYYDEFDVWQTICSDFDEVSVWIFEDVEPDAGIDQYLCDDFEFILDATPTTFCLPGYSEGEWTFVGGPANVVFDGSQEDPLVQVETGGVTCPWGAYTFRYTEKNGFFATGADPMGWCEGYDDVTIYIYEPLDIDAGDNLAFCDQFEFYLDGSLEPLCTDYSTIISWSVVSQPDACDVTFTPPYSLDPMVSITNCAGCQYGDYVFKVRIENGYYDRNQVWQMVCWDEDEVTVTIYEHPDPVDAGDPQLLCDDFTFDLAADLGADYCGANSPWYSWGVVSTPDPTCTITFSAQTSPATSVEVSGCTGECAYGVYVFRFTEWNGLDDCYSTDIVEVTIYEMPDAQAGLDVKECVTPNDDLCYDMTAELDYCYEMMGLWTKSCGPGDVVFSDPSDPSDPNAEACFSEPGRYKFTWTVWNAAENCEDEDEVIFDLLEEPIASADATEIYTECNTLCVDLGLAGVTKYEYIGTEWTGDPDECPNYWDLAHWTVVSGPGVVTFDPAETAPDADICVDAYGGYTLRWNEINRSIDGMKECSDYVDVYVEFNATPQPLAEGGEICDSCFTLTGTLDAGFNPSFYWEFISGPCAPTFDPFALNPEVCIDDNPECYGLYTFKLHQFNGECEGTAIATILFKQLPPPLSLCYKNFANECGPDPGPPPIDPAGCLEENDVLYACAEGNSVFFMDPECNCEPGFDWNNPLNWGWTFEWSVIAPAGTDVWAFPGYYDFEYGEWHYPSLFVTWGECCDTARIYLTATNPEGCARQLEYKVFVHHKPCIDIVGPDEAEVGLIHSGVDGYMYCNDCPDNPCLVYNWTAEPCGRIISGQGEPCVYIEWDSYVINGGWGQVTLEIYDLCTGCCNYQEYAVKVYPSGTLGTSVLSGYVYYENNYNTPLNGVEIQLWNGDVPVMSTVSFNDIEGGNGVGYFEFDNLSAVTPFGVTATYGAPWYGANATDALAVELASIGPSWLPPGFVYDDVVEEAMNVNNSVAPLITAVDALWIKQRAINMINYFPAGNWAFDQTMQTTATTGYNIFALSMGDANRSNTPNSNFKSLSVDMITDGMMNVVNGQEFELPIRIAKADVFGAMTLHLDYNPAMIEVVDVVAMEGMLSNISGNTVSIAWSNTNPMTLADNDVVITLKAKAIGEIASTESALTVGYGSEFADPTAKVIEPVTLKTFGVTTEPAALDYFLSSNRPNPFSTSTFIEYTMPETGKVKLSVLDMLGQELAVLVDATQNAGSYTVEFSAAGLATGVYLYKITVDGETRDFISTQRMVVSH